MNVRRRNWTIREGTGPIVALAIHNGSSVREELRELLGVDESCLRREEDHYTGEWTSIVDTSIVLHVSRFECDLNRSRKKSLYMKPEDAWGLNIWREPPPPSAIERSLKLHDAFYSDLEAILKRKAQSHQRFVVFDIHSYCHRRGGPSAEPDSPLENPDINLGTGSIDRTLWAPVVESFLADMSEFDYLGGKLDVRENVKFKGGYLSTWVNETFPGAGCALAIEIKKFYMDEWTGQPHPEHIEAVKRALGSTVANILKLIEK